MRKRILAALCAAALCMAMLPTAVIAATTGSNEYFDDVELYVKDGEIYLNVLLGAKSFDDTNQGIYAVVMPASDEEFYPDASVVYNLYNPMRNTEDELLGFSGPNAYGVGYGYYAPGDMNSNKVVQIDFDHYWAGDPDYAIVRGERADSLPTDSQARDYILYVWSGRGGGNGDNVLERRFTVQGGDSTDAFVPPSRLPQETTAVLLRDGTPVYRPEGMRFPTVALVDGDGTRVPELDYIVTWYAGEAHTGRQVEAPSAAGDYYAAVTVRSAYADLYRAPDPVRYTVYRSEEGTADEAPYLVLDQLQAEDDVLSLTGSFDLKDETASLEAVIRSGIEYAFVSRAALERRLPAAADAKDDKALRKALYEGGLTSVSSIRAAFDPGELVTDKRRIEIDEEMEHWSADFYFNKEQMEVLSSDCVLALSVNDSYYVAKYLYVYTFDWGKSGSYGGDVFDAVEPERAEVGQDLPELPAGAVTLGIFPDAAGHWAEESICRLAALGIITGYPNGNFGPEDPMTRCELATVLSRFYGLRSNSGAKDFNDAKGHWASGAIGAVCDAGLMKGVGGGAFAPNELITREQLAVVLARAEQLNGAGAAFSDDGDIASWAKDGVYAAQAAGLVTGYPDGSFGPQDPATRSAVAAVLARILEE